MGKRFTETNKWDDPWFRKLSPEFKLGWYYLTDRCDGAGVIELDEELANFQAGAAVDWDGLVAASGDRVRRLANGRLWLTKFIKFQYGKLSVDCKPHLPIIQLLKKHGLKVEDIDQNEEFRCTNNVPQYRKKQVFERDAGICCYCGNVFEDAELEADHFVPISRGGGDGLANLVAACRPCNRRKWDRDPFEFIASLEDSESAIQRAQQRVPQRVPGTLEEKETDKEKEKEGGVGDRRFRKPDLTEVAAYCVERKNNVDPQAFLDHYTSNGWRVGKNPMRDWKASVRTWEKNSVGARDGPPEKPPEVRQVTLVVFQAHARNKDFKDGPFKKDAEAKYTKVFGTLKNGRKIESDTNPEWIPKP